MTLEKGVAMTPNLPSTCGGAITSWEISPSLPSGLTLGTSDGKISGTPSILQTTKVTYTVWANNSGVQLRQRQHHHQRRGPSSLKSPQRHDPDQRTSQSVQASASVSGGTITSWEISPSPGFVYLQFRKWGDKRNAKRRLDPYPIHDLGQQLWRFVRCLSECYHQRCSSFPSSARGP